MGLLHAAGLSDMVHQYGAGKLNPASGDDCSAYALHMFTLLPPVPSLTYIIKWPPSHAGCDIACGRRSNLNKVLIHWPAVSMVYGLVSDWPRLDKINQTILEQLSIKNSNMTNIQ